MKMDDLGVHLFLETPMCIPVVVQAAVYWQDFCAFFSQMERSLFGHPVFLPFDFCLILCMLLFLKFRHTLYRAQ